MCFSPGAFAPYKCATVVTADNFWAESGMFEFQLFCLFPLLQCADLWLTCSFDLKCNCVSFCWSTCFPLFSALTNSICRPVSLFYPVLFVHCFILDRLTICYDIGLWALEIGNVSAWSVTVRFTYLLVKLAYSTTIPKPPLTLWLFFFNKFMLFYFA